MCIFGEGHVRLPKYLNTNSTLPILGNQDSILDAEDKFSVFEKRMVRLE